jgi:hypothetical protein
MKNRLPFWDTLLSQRWGPAGIRALENPNEEEKIRVAVRLL